MITTILLLVMVKLQSQDETINKSAASAGGGEEPICYRLLSLVRDGGDNSPELQGLVLLRHEQIDVLSDHRSLHYRARLHH